MEKLNIGLESVPQTMLLTLYARAKYSQQPRHEFYDQRSVDIVSQLDYDFSIADKDVAMRNGTVARTIVLDKLVREYLEKNPNATVINLGCGLDTRFYRLDNGQVHWWNVDLSEPLSVRRRFFQETERVHMIPASAMDEAWAQAVGKVDCPVCVIMEGLAMYLSEEDIRQIFKIIDSNFTHATVFLEIMPHIWQRRGHKIEKSVAATKAVFTWSANSGKEVVPLAPAFKWERDYQLTYGMCKLYPAMRLISWLPIWGKISEKITIFVK
ncbi:MAG: class I SAM-dependent methyltransferase [Prevotella sp.]|nr:class I SAM-dependent methyltransferase [Prevotella sp.]